VEFEKWILLYVILIFSYYPMPLLILLSARLFARPSVEIVFFFLLVLAPPFLSCFTLSLLRLYTLALRVQPCDLRLSIVGF